jgi:site-specific recombinase XerD
MNDNRLQSIQDFDQYLKRRSPGSRTAIAYVSDVRLFAAACQKPWPEVSLHDIDAFVDHQRQAGLSAATIKRRVAALKVFFDFLAEESDDLSWPNPVRFKRHAGKQPKKLPRDLSDEQVSQLWAVITSPRDRAWFALMLRAGLRVGELVSLTLTAWLSAPTAEQPGRLRVCGKGQKERVVLLTADAYAVLQAWLQVRPPSDHDTIFLNERGQPLSANGVQWLLHRYGQQVGCQVTPHQLRHTFARQLTEAEMPLPSLSKLMGHCDISTTQIYTAGADPELAQAYQTAMAQLESTPLPVSASPSGSPAWPAVPRLRPVPSPLLPDLQAWAPELPAALRQASLDLVQRRLPTWKPQRRPQHIRRVLSQLRSFWRWQLTYRPLTQPTDLHLADLKAYQQARTAAGKAPATVNRTLDQVLAILRHLADQDQPLEASLFRLRPLPRPDSLPRHLSETDMQKLEAFVRQRLTSPDPLTRLENACFFVLAHTAIRASECVDLHLQDLELQTGRLIIRLGKGQRDRLVYLWPSAQQALTLYLRQAPVPPTSSLWIRPDGQSVTTHWLYRRIVALGQTAGHITVTPHRLRHTLATRLLNAGMEITRIQKLLGHDHLNTTMIYARVLDKTLEADYHHAMGKIEQQQMPLSRTPALVSNWPMPPTVDQPDPTEFRSVELDNSV